MTFYDILPPQKRPRLLLPIGGVALPVGLVAHAGEIVAGFGAGEMGEDGLGFGAGNAQVGGAPEQEGGGADLTGLVLGVEAKGPEPVLHAAPEHQQIGHREAGDVHGCEAVLGILAHVAVGAFEDVGGGADAELGFGTENGHGTHAHAVEDDLT
jgi:hypothetical protein